MPRPDFILETCLYVEDVARAREFYTSVFSLPVLFEDARICSLAVTDSSVLILFRRGASLNAVSDSGMRIPPHDGAGPAHMAFGISRRSFEEWRRHLQKHQIAIESEASWPLGGRSLYFRDPDGHLLELGTPGIWDFARVGLGRK